MEESSLAAIDFNKMNLPFQPHVLSAILKLREDSMMNFHDLENLIKSDQNLTTLILKVANSSFYYRGNEVKTLQQAIGMIGFQTVISFAMTGSIKNAFDMANYSNFRRLVWQHSIVTGIISRDLAIRLGQKEIREEAFIAGVLHDIGKVILNNLDRKKFIEVIHTVLAEGRPFHLVEREVFGYDHNEVGMRCIEFWKLPLVYQKIAGVHHGDFASMGDPLEGDEQTLLEVVCLAHFLAKSYGYGVMTGGDQERGERLFGQMGISGEDRLFYDESYGNTIKEDQFYKFFISFV